MQDIDGQEADSSSGIDASSLHPVCPRVSAVASITTALADIRVKGHGDSREREQSRDRLPTSLAAWMAATHDTDTWPLGRRSRANERKRPRDAVASAAARATHLVTPHNVHHA